MSFSEARSFYFLAIGLMSFFVLYLFFIGQTVFRLVAEKDMESRARLVSTEISELELETLSLNDTISIEKAYELGFVSPKTTRYAEGAVVTLR